MIRLGVELLVSTAIGLALGPASLIPTVAALMMAIYIARAVLWLIGGVATAIEWRLDRRGSIDRFAAALRAVDLPVTPGMAGTRDVGETLGQAALDPRISREAAAFAYSTRGFVEALHLHADPLAAAMVTSNMARALARHAARAGSPPV